MDHHYIEPLWFDLVQLELHFSRFKTRLHWPFVGVTVTTKLGTVLNNIVFTDVTLASSRYRY